MGTDNVYQQGQFSKRGGIVDIWLERYKMPTRVDLIGDKIEAIYLFNSLTQEKTRGFYAALVNLKNKTEDQESSEVYSIKTDPSPFFTS